MIIQFQGHPANPLQRCSGLPLKLLFFFIYSCSLQKNKQTNNKQTHKHTHTQTNKQTNKETNKQNKQNTNYPEELVVKVPNQYRIYMTFGHKIQAKTSENFHVA